MSSSNHNHTLPPPSISDVMSLLCTMKKENEKAMKEILTKLTRIEDDNRKLREELHEIKNCQKHIVKVSSKKRDEPEGEAEHKNEQSSSNKRARVSVAILPDLPASYDSLDDDCLGNVLDFVGKKCYSSFGRVNKRCNEMFCSKGLPKETYRYGYAPLRRITQRGRYNSREITKGVLHYNRRDILDWLLTDESGSDYWRLNCLCCHVIKESRLDILCEVFQRATRRQLEYLRDPNEAYDLCLDAAKHGMLECLKFLRENECNWDEETWYYAEDEGHEHILEYLRNNGYPTEWQN